MTNRKTVLVDLDNVVYPFTEVMAHLVVQNGLATSMPEDLIQLYRTWEVWDDWQVPKGGFNFVWERAIQTGEMWGVTEHVAARPIVRAQQALWLLNDREWHIHLVTSRLNKFRLHDTAVHNTADWLRWAGIPYRSLTFTSDKASILGDAIIDDHPDNLIGHPAPTKILYPAPHNQGFVPEDHPDITTLLSGEGIAPWDEIVEILGSGVKGWADARHG